MTIINVPMELDMAFDAAVWLTEIDVLDENDQAIVEPLKTALRHAILTHLEQHAGAGR